MRRFQTRFHLFQDCQLLISTMTPLIGDLIMYFAKEGPEGNFGGAKPMGSPNFKIILTGFDLTVVDLVREGRVELNPVSLILLDISSCPAPSADQLITELLSADTELQLVLLTAREVAPSRLLLHSMSRSHRVSAVHVPRDDAELGHLAKLILGKCISERSVSGNDVVSGGGNVGREETPMVTEKSAPLNRDSSSVRPATILIAEDDETVRWMMSQVLLTHNFRVLTAKNAEEAWEHWRKNINTINVIVTDINMPGGPDGVALGHAIQDEDGSVPVIYTSGNRAVQEFDELRPGSNYLVKPFRMDDLLEIVHRALAIQLDQGFRPASTRLVSWEKCAVMSD